MVIKNMVEPSDMYKKYYQLMLTNNTDTDYTTIPEISTQAHIGKHSSTAHTVGIGNTAKPPGSQNCTVLYCILKTHSHSHLTHYDIDNVSKACVLNDRQE